MRIAFWKMQGAGNDFILIDDRSGAFPAGDSALIRSLCARRTGIGSDGLILIQRSTRADFRMRFFNPDGREAEMCGNGARCAARLAHELGAAPPSMSFDTGAGLIRAAARGEQIEIHLTRPHAWRPDADVPVAAGSLRCGFVNTGVPHVVIETDDLAACDVAGLGSAVRWHPAFAPAGTNVNFVRVTGPRSLDIRTYERGVEGETLACGTGIAAAALVMARRGRVAPPVAVRPAGGDLLTVAFVLTPDGADDVVLTGPAVHVFRGDVEA